LLPELEPSVESPAFSVAVVLDESFGSTLPPAGSSVAAAVALAAEDTADTVSDGMLTVAGSEVVVNSDGHERVACHV
jgi:hypothetical protein